MILLPCPNCGPRDEGEFTYGGPQRQLPSLDGQSGTDDWLKALFHPQNPRGPMVELWYHASGCEAWIEVTRDTGTHEIIDVATNRLRDDKQ
ncbi:sarcosine oxidase subunit delta [uncultured Roseovarius sp.]|uniref:sarcosine oxidase subunit delta n=1 Tax=uncultured Roseovarius sp. TaxID=293344 RepID=UPI0026244C53|nr:sarcosine oxidase subunit delta [uncultured Roseovarius sp.]